jgi:DNA-binding IclR family transcriptional regulator
MPLRATSGGKVILTSIQQIQRDRILSRCTKITANTITSTALREELAATADTGIAYSPEELGVIGIGVAILKRVHEPEGSLSVVFPTVRDHPAHRKIIVDAFRAGRPALRQR